MFSDRKSGTDYTQKRYRLHAKAVPITRKGGTDYTLIVYCFPRYYPQTDQVGKLMLSGTDYT